MGGQGWALWNTASTRAPDGDHRQSDPVDGRVTKCLLTAKERADKKILKVMKKKQVGKHH